MIETSNFIGKTLEQYRLLMVSQNYLEYEPSTSYILDGGIELIIDGQPYCVSFLSEETQEFNIYNTSGNQLLDGYDFYEVDLDEEIYQERINKTITQVDLKNVSIIMQDYDGTLLEESKALVQLKFVFEDNSILQIAVVSYAINPESLQFSDIWYDFEGLIWVNFGEEVLIRE